MRLSKVFASTMAACALAALLLLPTSQAFAQEDLPLGEPNDGELALGAHSWTVTMPNGDFTGTVEDMNVKVLGGYVRVTREYAAMRWKVNPNWGGLTTEDFLKQYIPGYYFVIGSCYVSDPREDCIPSGGSSSVATLPDYDPYPAQINGVWFDRNFGAQEYGHIGVLYRNGVGFKRRQGGVFVLEGQPQYLIREMQIPTIANSTGPDNHPPAGIPGAGGLPTTMANGYRWQDRSGSFLEYDSGGRLVSYGDRHNNRVWMQYSSANRLERVLDHAGNTVITLHYTGDLLTEVRDYPDVSLPDDLPQRRVRYEYDSGGKLQRVTDVRGNVTTYNYTGSRLTSITDPEERIKAVAYGPTGRVESITEPDGAKTDYVYSYDKSKKHFYVKTKGPETPAGRRVEDHTYDDMGRMVRMDVNGRTELEMSQDSRLERYTDGRGNVTETRRNEFNDVVSETYADGSSVQFTFDPRLLELSGFRDENGISDSIEYDAIGNVVVVTEGVGTPEQRVTRFTPDAAGNILTVVREGATLADGIVVPASTIAFTYDARGNETSLTDGEGNVTRYRYNRLGNITRIIDPKQSAWLATYDAAGNQLSATTPLGHTATYEYDRAGNLTTVTDERGKITRWVYDGVNRETAIVDTYGKRYAISYNGWGLTTSETDEDGRVMRTEYDRDGRPSRSTDGRGNVIDMAYLAEDGTPSSSFLPTEITYPTFKTMQRFDARNRPVMDTTLLGQDGRVTSYRYDRRGDQIESTDEQGHTRYIQYDALARPKRLTDSLGRNIDMLWDTRDNLVRIRYPDGTAMRFEYDRANRLLREIAPLGQITSYEYDVNGNITTITRPNGARVVYRHDLADRVERAEITPAGATEPTLAYDYAYSPTNEMLSWTDGTHGATYTYDDAGRVLSETVDYGSGITLGYSYTYTDAGYKRTLTYPDGTVVTYEHDAAGVLSSVNIPGEGLLSVNEWDWVAPKKLTLPGGTVRELTHDGLLNVTGVKVRSPGQQLLLDLNAEYDDTELLSKRSIDGTETKYEYDTEERLLEAAVTDGPTETFTVDATGNRITHTATSGEWQYDANDRLIQRGDTTYEYDAAGNLTRKIVGTSGAPQTITRFSYDGLNRLIEVQDGSGATVATYAYDPFDNRLWKQVGGARTHYLYADEGLIAEAGSTGNVTTLYGWRPDGEWSTDPIFVRGALGSGPSTQVGFAYLHNDQLGTPIRATDRQGNVVWRGDYSSFGSATLAAANQLVQNLRLPGQYYDAETGLHYNTRRYYDPQTGRFVSQDPLGIGGGWNPYAYAGADPINKVDPTGEWVWIAIRVAITVYNVYTDYKAIKENGLCAEWTRLIPFPVKIPKTKWLTKRKRVCSTACECAGENSFTGDTLVHVRGPDGQPATMPISQVAIGDEVLALAEWKQPGEAISYEKVTDVISSEREQALVKLTLDTGETLTATAGHPFLTTEGWRDAALLTVDTRLLRQQKYGAPAEPYASVVSIAHTTGVVPAFNLEVANSHTFYVGEDGVLVHNSARPKTRKSTACAIWNAASPGSKPGTKKCSTCGKDVKGDPNKGQKRGGQWDHDHIKKWKVIYKKIKRWSRKKIRDIYNDPSNGRVRCVHCNRSDNQ